MADLGGQVGATTPIHKEKSAWRLLFGENVMTLKLRSHCSVPFLL